MPISAAGTPNHPDDTIVAVSSASGPGRRAIIRVSGPAARAIVDTVWRVGESASGLGSARKLLPGVLRISAINSPVPATLYFFPGPHSYTGQDLAEIHTIGSPPILEQLIADLLNAGARSAQPGEFTLRAFLAGKKDLSQAEAVQAVIEAGTVSEMSQALGQLAGGISQPLARLREMLLNLLADLEAALDFADEDIEFVSSSDVLACLESALTQLRLVHRQLEERTVSGRTIRIALVGSPNVGKSSLFNALTQGDALVSQAPGTTRDYLTRRFVVGGIEAELTDTAGWQAAEDTIEEQAQQLAREQTLRADVILWCVEAGQPFAEVDEPRLRATGAKVMRVWTKCDLTSPIDSHAVPASVVARGGLEMLSCALAEAVASLSQSPLAPSQSRCRHHVEACLKELTCAKGELLAREAPELVAASLRMALDELGAITGAIYTNDLLDRIFSRFCIGK